MTAITLTNHELLQLKLLLRDIELIQKMNSPFDNEAIEILSFKIIEHLNASQTLKENHIVDTNEMVQKGTLKKRMDKDGWFVVFQSNAYNESDMAYELLKSQEIDIDMYDVYKDGDEVTFEVVNKKWAKITPFLYPFKTTSSQTEISDSTIIDQIDGIIFELPFDDKIKLWELIDKLVEENRTEISDEEIEMAALHHEPRITRRAFKSGAKWYREQLKQR